MRKVLISSTLLAFGSSFLVAGQSPVIATTPVYNAKDQKVRVVYADNKTLGEKSLNSSNTVYPDSKSLNKAPIIKETIEVKTTVTPLPKVVAATPHQGYNVKGFYLTGGVGMNWVGNANLSFTNPNSSSSVDIKDNLRYLAKLGYDFGAFRTDLSLDYRNNSIAWGPTATRGNAKTYATMLNAYGDIENASRYTPYIGAGLGLCNLKQSASPQALASISKSKLCYQGILGLKTWLNQDWSADLEFTHRQGQGYEAQSGATKVEQAFAKENNLGAQVSYHF